MRLASTISDPTETSRPQIRKEPRTYQAPSLQAFGTSSCEGVCTRPELLPQGSSESCGRCAGYRLSFKSPFYAGCHHRGQRSGEFPSLELFQKGTGAFHDRRKRLKHANRLDAAGLSAQKPAAAKRTRSLVQAKQGCSSTAVKRVGPENPLFWICFIN